MRTQEEIRARLDAVRASQMDFFGKRQEVLAPMLEFENIKDILEEDSDPNDWGDAMTEDDTRPVVSSYLEFAIQKAVDHRGLSASRSIDAFHEYLWLFTDDATCAEFENVNYTPYGAPQLKFVAGKLGLSHIWDEAIQKHGNKLARMSAGLPCTDDCTECFG